MQKNGSNTHSTKIIEITQLNITYKGMLQKLAIQKNNIHKLHKIKKSNIQKLHDKEMIKEKIIYYCNQILK